MVDQPSVRGARGNRWVGGYALAASLVFGAASFLTWGSSGDVSVSGWERADGTVGDGPFVAVVAFLGIVFALLLLTRHTGLGVRIGLIVVGLLALGLSLIEVADVLGDGADLDPSAGLWLLVVSGAGLVSAGVLMRHVPKS